MMDWILGLIEKYGSMVSCWAWNKRWSKRDPNEWIKGYRLWQLDQKDIETRLWQRLRKWNTKK